MIPKRIFYMWCGSDKPLDVKLCKLSWQQKMPEYEFVEISEQNTDYFDFNEHCQKNDFFRFAYQNGMWAYVADYARFYVLEKFGGIWLDTDISVLKNFDDLLDNGVFFGRECQISEHVETAVIGAAPHHPLIKDVLSFYDNEIWECPLYTSPRIISACLKRFGMENLDTAGIIRFKDVTVYPPEYFFPLPLNKEFSIEMLTADSHCIHWWKSSWGRPEIVNWLKNKHLIGKEKSLKINLRPYVRLYLFGLIRIGHFDFSKNAAQIAKIPFIKIKKSKRKQMASLFGFIPLLKWK